jgi:hypothetical protein
LVPAAADRCGGRGGLLRCIPGRAGAGAAHRVEPGAGHGQAGRERRTRCGVECRILPPVARTTRTRERVLRHGTPGQHRIGQVDGGCSGRRRLRCAARRAYVTLEFVDARTLGIELLAHGFHLLDQFLDRLRLRRKGTKRRADRERTST